MLGKNSDILDIKILQMVRLLKNGEELKLSKRTGKTRISGCYWGCNKVNKTNKVYNESR